MAAALAPPASTASTASAALLSNGSVTGPYLHTKPGAGEALAT